MPRLLPDPEAPAEDAAGKVLSGAASLGDNQPLTSGVKLLLLLLAPGSWLAFLAPGA